MKLEIKHLETAEGHEVSGFLIDGYHELMHAGFAPRTAVAIPISYNHKVIYAEHKGKIVGAMTWHRLDWKNCLYIALGYVHQDYRRLGIYTRLWKEAVKKAQELNLAIIQGMSTIGNDAIEKTNESLGRRPIAITYQFDVPQKRRRKAAP